MSDSGNPKHTPGLLAGRWQIPLALVAAAVGGVALYHVIPTPTPVNFSALLAHITATEQAGDASSSVDLAEKLLTLQPPLPPEQRAVLHARLADMLFRTERAAAVHTEGNVRRLLEHSQAARELGQARSLNDELRDAFAHQWLGNDDAALKGFRGVLDQELTTDDRRAVLRAMVQILERRPQAKLERRQVMERLLADDGISPAYLWWGLQRAVQDALDENDTLRAGEILNQHGDRLANSELKGYLDYLRACVMLHEGRPQEAAPLVQWIDDWLGQDTRATAEMDDFGHLPSLNRWLMGKINMAQGRPEDALADFDEAVHYRPGPELRVAAGIGRGLAFAALDRHSEALAGLETAVGEAGRTPGRREHALNEFQRALLELYERQSGRGDAVSAVAYLTLAIDLAADDSPEHRRELLEKLGAAHAAAAEQSVGNEPQRREHHAQAGTSLESAAELAALDESRVADLLWAAAGAYDRAGRVSDERRVLRRFLEGRSEHPRLPQAMLQLGRACEACGDPEEARSWYARVITEYPRLVEASQAQVQRAGLLVSLGPDHYAEAEQSLAELLVDGTVAPEAGVYRDALLQLCDLLNYQGRYGEAIGRLEEFLRLYPRDPEHLRACFTLADAYRHSALALRDHAASGAAAESQARFREAAELFGRLLGDLETVQLDGATQLYARLALFYRGECLLALKEPETTDAALAVFRTAAARYEGQPAALTAQMQIANIHLRRGELREAGRAIEVARWLLRSMSADAFTRLNGGSKAEWERSLSVLSTSDLFKDVFASTP